MNQHKHLTILIGLAAFSVLLILACGRIPDWLDRLDLPQIGMTPTATESPIPTKTPTPEPDFDIGSTMVNPNDGAMMVYVPEGVFIMGSEAADALENEKPERMVYLDAYWIYQHPVTNDAYQGCVEAGECGISWFPPLLDRLNDPTYGDYPVAGLNWLHADTYCQWAGGRLPTEAEWEKAARGTDGRNFPWGDEKPTCSLANYVGCVGNVSEVGSYPEGVSPYEVYDMAGNVMEWVADWYAEDYYSHAPNENPTGPTHGTSRVLRGGSFMYKPEGLRVSLRFWDRPDTPSYLDYGFRCLRSATDAFLPSTPQPDPPERTVTPSDTITPLAEDPTPTVTEAAPPVDPTPTETERPLLPPAEIDDLLEDKEGLFFWAGSEIYRTDLTNFSTEVFYVSEFVPMYRWRPDFQYRARIEREDTEGGLDRPGGTLVIETFPEGEILEFDQKLEDVFSYSWGPEPGQITFSTFYSDAYVSWGDEDVVIASLQIFDMETGSLETLLTDPEPELYYVGRWSSDKRLLRYSRARYATGYYPRASVFDRQTLETIDLPCNICIWSPDEKYFAGTGFSTYERVDLPLLLVDFPSLAVKELYMQEGYTADWPIWSPKGDWIAFRIYTYDEALIRDHIYLRETIPLLIHAQTQELVELPVMGAFVRFIWHPEGTQVVVVVQQEHEDHTWAGESVYIYDFETEEMHLIFETDEKYTSGFRFILQEE